MYDDSFEEMRGEALNYMANKNKDIIENWCKECGMTEPVGYYNDLSKHELTIYTTRCGIMVGKAGKHVYAVKEVLKEEFNHDYEIKFVEIRGNIVNIKN
jgi:ribosomal protein S3